MWEKNIHHLFFPIAITAGVALFLIIVRSILFRIFSKKLEKNPHPALEATLKVIRIPSFYWCIITAAYIGVSILDIDSKYIKPLSQFVNVLIIVSMTSAISSTAVVLFSHFMRTVNGRHRVSGLSVGMIKSITWTIGLSLILSVFGISLAPLLTALGVGGLAVALALKDTLENVFAGIYLLTDRTIRVGDFVRLESGQEGKVEDIGWRTTKIESGSTNLTVIPNSKLAQSIVTNYCLPERRMALVLNVTVNAVPDTSKVLDILSRVSKQASEDVVGVLSSPPPTIRFTAIGSDGTLTFQVNFQVKEFSHQAFALHEMRRRVYAALLSEGFSFPQKTLVTPA